MTTYQKTRLFFRILFVLYIIALAYLCFGHFDSVPRVKPYFLGYPIDKVVHFLMFFPFPLLLFAAFDRITTKPWHSLVFAVLVFLLGCLLAAGTEIGQGMTTYRSADPWDFRADALALAISSVIVLVIDLAKQFIPEKKDNKKK